MVFSSYFWHKAPKTFDISCAESEKDIFCYVNEMTFRNYLMMGAGCQGRDGTSNPTRSLLGGEMGWRLSSVTNVQSFNQPCPCKEASIKAQEGGVQKALGLVNVWKVLNLE